jgi:hypothetical protein
VHPPAGTLARRGTPQLGDDVDVAIAIHIADLELMAAQPLISEDSLDEFTLAKLYPGNPPVIVPAGREQFLLLVEDDIRPAIPVDVGHGQGMERAIGEALGRGPGRVRLAGGCGAVRAMWASDVPALQAERWLPHVRLQHVAVGLWPTSLSIGLGDRGRGLGRPRDSGALQPAVLDASLEAASRVDEQRRQVIRDWERRGERARYEADRAARQYHACEPENRLVGRTLERRWDEALQAVRKVEEDFDHFLRAQPRVLGETDRERIRRLAAEVPALWHAPTTTHADRGQIARLLIDRVVLTIDAENDYVKARVEWAGGAVRQRTLPSEVLGYKKQQEWKSLSCRIGALDGLGETPNVIATIFDREGFRPPKRATRFMAGIVRRLLHELGLTARVPRQTMADVLASGEVWLHDLAQTLALSPYTLHGWRKKGWMLTRQLGGRGGP